MKNFPKKQFQDDLTALSYPGVNVMHSAPCTRRDLQKDVTKCNTRHVAKITKKW